MKKWIAIIAITLLSACGFHLRGKYPFDTLPAQEWVVSGGTLQKPLETALRYASGTIVTQSDTELRVLSLDAKRDIYTITRAAKLNEYLLSLYVVAQAYRNGKPWGKPLIAHVRRNMPYSDTEVLGKGDEEATLWQEIYQDAAQQLVRQLGFLAQEKIEKDATKPRYIQVYDGRTKH